MPLGWNTCLSINFDIENFEFKTCDLEKGSIIFLILSIKCAFNSGEWELVSLVLYTSLQWQVSCTYSLPILYICSTSNWRHIRNPIKHLRCRFFAEIVNVLRLLAVFIAEFHCVSSTGCLTGFWMQPCPITYRSSKEIRGEAFDHWSYTRES